MKDFYGQFNSFMSDFKFLGSNMRNYLFFKYSTAFYGSQFLPMYDMNIMNELTVAWRLAVKKVWRILWTTHSRILPILADSMPQT